MDPILIIALAAVGLLAGPKLIKVGFAKLIVSADKKKRDNLTHNMLKKEYKQKQQQEKYRQKLIAKGIDPDKVIKYDMDRFHNLQFTGVNSKTKKIVSVREDASFNEKEDVLLKGRLHIVDSNGHRTVQDIYLYQPRMFSENNVLIGPKLDKTGKLSDRYTYLCRGIVDKEILTSYVPKREVFSSMQFDFIPNSAHSFVERNPNNLVDDEKIQHEQLEKYIYIDGIERDSDGQFIPVDLNDPKQREAFENYKKAHLGNQKTPQDYFDEQLNIAKTAFYNHLNEYRPDYAVASSEPKNESDKSEPKEDESEKEQKESINDFYKRYDYYRNPIFGERYNDYNGEYNNNNEPHHHR